MRFERERVCSSRGRFLYWGNPDATVEHLIDRQFGGPTREWNCVLAHRGCNNKRNYMLLPEKLASRVNKKRKEKFVRSIRRIWRSWESDRLEVVRMERTLREDSALPDA